MFLQDLLTEDGLCPAHDSFYNRYLSLIYSLLLVINMDESSKGMKHIVAFEEPKDVVYESGHAGLTKKKYVTPALRELLVTAMSHC